MRRVLVGLFAIAAAGCSLDLYDPGPGPDPEPNPDPDPDPDPDATELEDVSTFWLPINSIRLGASGRVPDADVCVGLVWFFSSVDDADTQHCDDFAEDFPYAVVQAATPEGCGEVWNYGPNAAVLEASGCIVPDLETIGPHAMDVTVDVSSPLFTGTVHLVSPGSP
jgi:hypothetical protein